VATGKTQAKPGATISRLATSAVGRIWRAWDEAWGRMWAWLRTDWAGARVVPWGVALALLTVVVVALYYGQTPAVIHDPDTRAYLTVARRILARGQLVNTGRLPGYPLFIIAVGVFAGQGNLATVSVAQGALFVVATLEVYAMLALALRRAWLAAGVAALLGTNLRVLSYVKPILSEGVTLFLTVTLALAVTLYLRRASPRRLWLVAGCMLALFMTRPEWIYLPIPLIVFLVLIAWGRGAGRRIAWHALGGVVALYAVLGLYILGNSVVNGFSGVTYIQNINLLGKVMQYQMQNEAPSQYAPVTHVLNGFAARHDVDPWQATGAYAPLRQNNFALAGHYAAAIIVRHPIEFVAKSLPVAVHSLRTGYPFQTLTPRGALATPLRWLDQFSGATLGQMVWFLALAPLWWALLLARRWPWARRRLAGARARLGLPSVSMMIPAGADEIMAGLSLLAAYDLALTTFGGYVYYDRLHAPFDPLLMAVVWGSAALAVVALARLARWGWGRIASRRIVA